jgi:hypothetical protein
LWLNDYDKDEFSNILIDKRYYGGLKKDNQTMLYVNTGKSSYTILGYWLNDNLVIGDISDLNNFDYIISRDNLNLDIIKKGDDGIYIYKIK